MIIAVDFDGTCVIHAYPGIGEEMPYCTEVSKALVKANHDLLLWTCREDHQTHIDKRFLQDAVDWFAERDIPLIGVNRTPKELEFREEKYKDLASARVPYGRKALADIYVDDRNLGGFPGWLEVHRIILGCEYKESI